MISTASPASTSSNDDLSTGLIRSHLNAHLSHPRHSKAHPPHIRISVILADARPEVARPGGRQYHDHSLRLDAAKLVVMPTPMTALVGARDRADKAAPDRNARLRLVNILNSVP